MIIAYFNAYTLQYDRLLSFIQYMFTWFVYVLRQSRLCLPALDYVLTKYCDRNKLDVELSTKVSVLKSQNPQTLCGPNASAKSTGLIVYYC